VKFILKKFNDKGISVDRSQLEEKCQLFKADHIASSVEKKIERLSRQDLDFCSIYSEVMENDDDISIIDGRKETPFSSLLEQEAL
jgi:hypothetical protein